jgi:hypothetical protein
MKYGGEHILAVCHDKEDADRVSAAIEGSSVEEWEVEELLHLLRQSMDRRETRDRRKKSNGI